MVFIPFSRNTPALRREFQQHQLPAQPPLKGHLQPASGLTKADGPFLVMLVTPSSSCWEVGACCFLLDFQILQREAVAKGSWMQEQPKNQNACKQAEESPARPPGCELKGSTAWSAAVLKCSRRILPPASLSEH